jgi:hypothetical protein
MFLFIQSCNSYDHAVLVVLYDRQQMSSFVRYSHENKALRNPALQLFHFRYLNSSLYRNSNREFLKKIFYSFGERDFEKC